jgi:hypothetical protein
MKISVAQLPRTSEEKATLAVKFSRWHPLPNKDTRVNQEPTANVLAEDGKEMSFDPETVKIKKVIEEVDRHSRLLARQEDLTSS